MVVGIAAQFDMVIICMICMLRPFTWAQMCRWWWPEYRHVVQYAHLVSHDYSALERHANGKADASERLCPGEEDYKRDFMSRDDLDKEVQQVKTSSTVTPSQLKLQRAYRKLKSSFVSNKLMRHSMSAHKYVAVKRETPLQTLIAVFFFWCCSAVMSLDLPFPARTTPKLQWMRRAWSSPVPHPNISLCLRWKWVTTSGPSRHGKSSTTRPWLQPQKVVLMAPPRRLSHRKL